MREVTLYIADDGTEFRNEMDCINYELEKTLNNMSSPLANIKMWDDEFKPIDTASIESLSDLEIALDTVKYVIGSDSASLEEMFTNIGYEHVGIDISPREPWKAYTRYYYDYDTCQLEDFDEKYGKIIEFNDKFKVGE